MKRITGWDAVAWALFTLATFAFLLACCMALTVAA